MPDAVIEAGLTYRIQGVGHLRQEDVPRVASELAQLAHQHGETISATTVVSAASDPQSAMHRYFEWDDTAAAHEYRLSQARQLIRSIQVNVITKPGPNPERAWTRQYHNVRVSEPEAATLRAYVPLQIVIKDEDKLREVIENAQRELFGWRERVRTYQDFEEFRRFQSVLTAIDDLRQD